MHRSSNASLVEHLLNAEQNSACFWRRTQPNGVTGRLLSAQWDPWPRLGELKDELNGTDIYTLAAESYLLSVERVGIVNEGGDYRLWHDRP